MNKNFLDICQIGNFMVEDDIDLTTVRLIRKKGDNLFAVLNNREYKLISMDDASDVVVRNFSDMPDSDNESIYECRVVKGHLVIMLYVFSEVRRIHLESETMHFYIERLLKNEFEAKGIIKNDDEIEFLNNEFLFNHSVFIMMYQGDRAIRTFQMYGNEYCAHVEKERPGVYRIKRLYKYKVNNRVNSMVQIYGHVKFVTFDEAIKIKGYESAVLEIKTNEIFKAWQEFVTFEDKLFNNDVIELGYAQYSSYKIEEDEIVLQFEKNIEEIPLFRDRIKAIEQEYDIVIPKTGEKFNSIEEIVEQRAKSRGSVINLGRMLNESLDTNSLSFNIPYINFDIPSNGYIILSNRNIYNERKRRDNVMRAIESKSNSTSNMIMKLSAGEEDSQTGSDIKPIKESVLRKMFGRGDVSVKENFRNAMYIALNTPDIALIQGPPGTGKTTLINGIVARLGEMGNKNYKILLSSEQHEALYNVVDKFSGNAIPPYVISEKYGETAKEENNARMNANIENFQQKILSVCKDILSERSEKDDFSKSLTKIVFDIQTIIDKNYEESIIRDKLEKIIQASMIIGIWNDVKECIGKIETKMSSQTQTIEDDREGMDFIKRKYNSQRLDKKAFYEDDGIFQLRELQKLIMRYGYNYLLMDNELMDNLIEQRDDESFEKYIEYIKNIRNEILPDYSEFELAITSYKELFANLLNIVHEAARLHKKDFYDIIEALQYKMNDTDNVKEIVKKYTSVVGSTCAQAAKSMDVVNLNGNKYDYVIIDEAARANPLDIMIPVLMGTRVIMVGDQMQLPHYVENDYVRRFKKEKDKCEGFDEETLTKSLFQILYDSLEKSWNEGKLKFRRHIRIQEQHRMHPVIGQFISDQFYGGQIENGERTKNNVNNFNVFNGRNAVWVDVPITYGMEERVSSKLYRKAEADKLIEILREIVRKNPNRNLKIGIMAFYKGQVELLKSMLAETFSDEMLKYIECNTVDSYQGKEFDIVLLSTTRSNREMDIEKSLGFIHYSKSRINVSLSRAKSLLVVIGDGETMARNEIFKNYIDYVKKI